MTEWVKRLQGYVKIRVWGFAPQRFINLCSNKGILLWNIEKQEDVYTMCIGLRSFYELRPIARKTKEETVTYSAEEKASMATEIKQRMAALFAVWPCASFQQGSGAAAAIWSI